MQYLTPSEIKKVAPAISKLPTEMATQENLIDTTVFLRHLETLGYRPITVLQGTPHADAKSQSRGRHLAVAANRRGEVIAILNSHTVWRRAWLGAGYLIGATEAGPEFILGTAVPLPRWRGFEEPLALLQDYQTALWDAKSTLNGWLTLSMHQRWMARYFAPRAYLPGHKTPRPQELIDPSEWPEAPATAVLAHMLRAVRRGGLRPDSHPVAHVRPRKLKPIQSPDALFKASNVAFQTGIAAMAKYKIGTYAFPQFNVGNALLKD